jgi:hypothetical protein
MDRLEEVFVLVRRANKLNSQLFAEEIEDKPDNWLDLPELQVNLHIETQLSSVLGVLSQMSGIQLHAQPVSRIEYETLIKKLFHCVRRHSQWKVAKVLYLLLKFSWTKRKLSKELANSERLMTMYRTAQAFNVTVPRDNYARSEVVKTGVVLQSGLFAYWRFVESGQDSQVERFNLLSEAADKLSEQVRFCAHIVAEQAGSAYTVKDAKVLLKSAPSHDSALHQQVLETEHEAMQLIEVVPKPDYVFVMEGQGTDEHTVQPRAHDVRQAKLSYRAIEELKARQGSIPQQPIVHVCLDLPSEAPPPPSTVPKSSVGVLEVRSLCAELQERKRIRSEGVVFGD